MASEQTSRWKHTDAHADLCAFLGDAAGLFSQQIARESREHLFIELVHQYGLSSTLAEQAISALELAHGDSHVAYELLAQWSIGEANPAPPTSAGRIARRLAKLDEQPTHDECLALEQAAWSEVEAVAANSETDSPSETSVEMVISGRFDEFLRNRIDARLRASSSLSEAISSDVQQRLIAAGVRQFGMRRQSARDRFNAILAELANRCSDEWTTNGSGQGDVSASPDTLPDLDCIMEEEADLLDRSIAAAEPVDSAHETNQSQRDSFRDYVDQRLANIRGNLVDARQWKKWTNHATVHFGLSSNDAAHLIEERSHKRRMRVLTPQRAADQLATLAASLYHRHGKYPAKVKNRLLAAASQLGVDAAEVRRILDSPPPQPVAPATSGQPSYKLLLAVSATAASLMIGFFAWVALSQRPGETPIANRAERPRVAAEEAAPPPFQPPIWWDRQTIAAAESVTKADASVSESLHGFASESASQRRTAALELLDRIDFGNSSFQNQRDQFRQVFVGYLALEPEQHVALDTFRVIAQSLNDITVDWPNDLAAHASVYWRLDVLLAAIESPLSTRARADAFAVALTDTLQIARDTSKDLAALREACALCLTQRCFDVMMNSIDRTPAAILAAHGSLSLACRPYVEPVHVDRFESKLLCSLLLDGRQWNDFRHLIRHQIGSPDTLNVLRFVAAYEKMPDTPTRARLGGALLSRVGLRHENRTPEQTGRVVRTALEHGQRGDRFVARWERFTFNSERWLATENAAESEHQLPQAVVGVAHRNLLGTALSLHDNAGASVFDQFVAEGAPQLPVPSGDDIVSPLARGNSTPNYPEMPTHVAKELLRRCQLLFAMASGVDQQRDWEIAIRIIDRWHEIPPPVATLLGRYILSPHESRHESAVIEDSQRLMHSTELRLAIGEAVIGSELDDSKLASRLSTIFGRSVVISSMADRQKLRHSMLTSVYHELQTDDVAVPSGSVNLETLREQLTRIYRAKARLLGVSPGAYLTASNPAEILTAMIDQEIERHDASTNPHLNQLRAQSEAIRFRASSELEETVLLQRLWVRLVAWQATNNRPDDSSEVDLILAQLDEQADESLLEQLSAGEVAELKLWLLRNELR